MAVSISNVTHTRNNLKSMDECDRISDEKTYRLMQCVDYWLVCRYVYGRRSWTAVRNRRVVLFQLLTIVLN